MADLWACFNGEDFGEFDDIDKITMFAGKSDCSQLDQTRANYFLDYRIPQMLHQLGCMRFSPPLEARIRSLEPLTPGSNWEVELRGTSIWCVELIKREIEKRHPEVKSAGKSDKASGTNTCDINEDSEELAQVDEKTHKTYGINAILIDFFLYDTMKDLEAEHNEGIPHHRTRSIWY